MLDVLLYLFENYLYDEPESNPDLDALRGKLMEAGFPSEAIERAFEWLDTLSDQRQAADWAPRGDAPVRIYTNAECQRLDNDCRGFLMFLDDCGILTAANRELVIDRVMALEEEEVDLEQLKWIILLVLFKQPGQEEAFARMEDLVFDEETEYLN